VIAITFLILVKEPKHTKRVDDSQRDELTWREQVKVITSQVWTLCKSDIVFPICLIGTMMARALVFLFNIFFMLWISSEVKDSVEA
jgi:hypothetical protein